MPYADPEKKRAYSAAYRARPEVRAKRAAYFQTWTAENKEHLVRREAIRRLTKRAQCLVATTRTRAKKKNIPFDLDTHIEEIQNRIDVGFCELSGIQFDLSPGRTFASPSIDRIVPSNGYLYPNIRIVCHGVNVALGDWGEEIFEIFARAFLAMQSCRRSRRRS